MFCVQGEEGGMNKIEELFSPYKITLDESYAVEKDLEAKEEKWRYYELHGKHGMIYPYSRDRVVVVLNTFGKEKRYFFHTDQFKEALKLVNPNKKRVYSPEYREVLRQRLFKARKTQRGMPL